MWEGEEKLIQEHIFSLHIHFNLKIYLKLWLVQGSHGFRSHMPLNHPVYTKTVLSLYVLFTGWPGYRITSFCDPNILQHSQLPHGCLGLTCSAYHPFTPCWLRCQVQILFCQKCVCAFLTHEKINSPPNLKWFSLHPTQIRFNSHPYLQFHALAQGEFLLLFSLLHPHSSSLSLHDLGVRSSCTTTIQVQGGLGYWEL